MQDEEVILSHQDAVMDHDQLQYYGQNLHPNLPEQLLIHDSTFNPVDNKPRLIFAVQHVSKIQESSPRVYKQFY